MKNLILTISILLVLTNCKKSSLRGDHFIFGSSYSECEGNCVNYFMLKKGQLYPDDMTNWSDKLKFKNNQLTQDKIDLAKKIEDNLPDFLKTSSSSTFGCPNCRDQGAIYIEIKNESKTTKFSIDTDTTQIPVEIRKYISDIKLTLGQL
jgi:hypothetical protein